MTPQQKKVAGITGFLAIVGGVIWFIFAFPLVAIAAFLGLIVLNK